MKDVWYDEQLHHFPLSSLLIYPVCELVYTNQTNKNVLLSVSLTVRNTVDVENRKVWFTFASQPTTRFLGTPPIPVSIRPVGIELNYNICNRFDVVLKPGSQLWVTSWFLQAGTPGTHGSLSYTIRTID